MTLTDIIPTLRMSIPDPIDLTAWPPQTSVTVDDVACEGLSMSRVAGLLGTPCVWSTEHSSATGCATLVVCTVSAVMTGNPGAAQLDPKAAHPIVLIDWNAERSGAQWHHVRLIRRVSVAHKTTFEITHDGSAPAAVPEARVTRSDGAQAFSSVALPRDIVAGDVLIVPCLPSRERTGVCDQLATTAMVSDAETSGCRFTTTG